VEFALGLLAALIGATGALTGAWLAGRHQAQLERDKWQRAREDTAKDARAAAITELTRDMAAALQSIVWFMYAAGKRASNFNAQTIFDYDAEMRSHFTATMQGLVNLAHHDDVAFRALDQLATEIWDLDSKVSAEAANFSRNEDEVRTNLYDLLEPAYELMRSLPVRIVGVLQRDRDSPDTSSVRALV